MRTLDKKPSWQLSEFDKPFIAASYFGFTPITTPKIIPIDIENTNHCVEHPHYDAVEKAALIRTYHEQDFASLPHPLGLVYRRPARKMRTPGGGTIKAGYSLHFIGNQTGIAEASLIRAALSMLGEVGYKNLRVELNCVGDKESLATYERELINYVKKFGSNIGEELRAAIKADVFNLFRSQHEEAIQFRASAPASISYLSAQSRNHFKEVLEFIEALGIEFGLAPELIGEKNHSSHTIFGIRPTGIDAEQNPSGGDYLAVGYRYSRLGRRLGMKREIPMAGCSLFYSEKENGVKKVYKELPKAKFYLVQLGQAAKIKTLGLIELLRLHRIPVHHFLGKDKLTAQLSGAETLRVPYLIIIGQKEALDGTATVRNMNTRAQDTIPMERLPDFLKHISL
ncbi:MAG: His/Gly/Thr/Pro-type tRNA ligase C-terminal domain-containing protein [Patescibacteria group bacterium]|mgnify:FL=1